MARSSQVSKWKPYALAWVLCIALIASISAPILYGLQQTSTGAITTWSHLHGVIVQIKSDTFALRVSGQKNLMWFRMIPDSPISMAHLERHLKEHAATDVVYAPQPQAGGMYWAWDAD